MDLSELAVDDLVGILPAAACKISAGALRVRRAGGGGAPHPGSTPASETSPATSGRRAGQAETPPEAPEARAGHYESGRDWASHGGHCDCVCLCALQDRSVCHAELYFSCSEYNTWSFKICTIGNSSSGRI